MDGGDGGGAGEGVAGRDRAAPGQRRLGRRRLGRRRLGRRRLGRRRLNRRRWDQRSRGPRRRRRHPGVRHPRRGVDEGAAARKPVLGPLRHGPAQRIAQLRRERGLARQLADGLVEVRGEHGQRRAAAVRRGAGEQLEQEAGQGVLVGPTVHLPRRDLLRRGVGRREQQLAGHRQHARLRRVAADAEVGEHRVVGLVGTGVGQKHVLRLHVAVDDAGAVRGVEGGTDLPGDVQRLVERQPSRIQAGPEVTATDVLHREIQLPVVLAAVVHHDDVRMREAADQVDLTQEAVAEPVVLGEPAREHLQDVDAGQPGMPGEVQHTHAAARQLALHTPARDDLPGRHLDHGGHRMHRSAQPRRGNGATPRRRSAGAAQHER